MSRKIINDPVYGFITIDHELLLNIIDHPYFQRLRYIHQMAFAHLVYPGAIHSRFHHSLGAYHLACVALNELQSKGYQITEDESLATKIAVLLHDVGHGPFSHALEKVLLEGYHHESLSLLIMQKLNREFNGKLSLAIEIFTNAYPKQFLHQLVSSQLDVDRMDYLNRDSFYTGVAEGVIGYDRILKMLAVHNDKLVVEEKAIYSVEKFLLSRRLMYWQVYLHKTVLSAELMLVKLIERAKQVQKNNQEAITSSKNLQYFFEKNNLASLAPDEFIEKFCKLDDTDVVFALKEWSMNEDEVLKTLAKGLLERKIYKIKLQAHTFLQTELDALKESLLKKHQIAIEDVEYYIFSGETSNAAYVPEIDSINILYKNGDAKDISQVEHALIQNEVSKPVKKYFVCALHGFIS